MTYVCSAKPRLIGSGRIGRIAWAGLIYWPRRVWLAQLKECLVGAWTDIVWDGGMGSCWLDRLTD